MQPIGRTVRFGVAVVALWFGGAQGLSAQGITSAAVQGRITSENRGTVENAIVALTNSSTGARQQTSTNSAGRYNFENVPPGGPYTIDVRAIGFQSTSKAGVMLALGQRYVGDFELKQQVVTLEELTVVAATNPLINSARTGPAQIVTDTAIQRYPLLGRNFTDLLRTSPHVLSGSGVGGQNSKFNTILIDGGANNDVFGVSATPGSSAGAKLISLEALQEFQILVAPFDIRQGSFSGGLVNGITKSGTNEFHGSVFGYTQRPEIVGADTARKRLTPQQAFDIKQYGGTLGGPIIRNKLHFFGAVDVQSSQRAFFGLEATEPATGIPVSLATRVQQILRDQYGFDPGGVDAPGNLQTPNKTIFGKLTWQVGGSTQVEASYNYLRGTDDNFFRSTSTRVDRDGWMLSNSGYKIGNTTHTARGKLTSLIGGANLEVLLGYMRIRDARELPNRVPQILVFGSSLNTLAAGGEKFSHGNELDQDVYEATANLTFNLGASHQITVGTHNEFFHFRNLFAQNRYGTWNFASADSLEQGLPRYYEALLEARPGGFTAKFGVKQLGGYVQDAWRPLRTLTLTGGIRFDVPIFNDTPFQNTLAGLTQTLHVNTGDFPSGNVLWSPRLGFNWDVVGQGNTIVRGGAGLFSGRPPYVWMSNAFTGTGLEQLTIQCSRVTNFGTQANVPAFTVDVDNLPRACAGGAEPAPPAATVAYFDKNFKFQQALKLALGVDQRLPGGMVFTFDFLHTRNRNQMYQTDDNVKLGEINAEGRQLYGEPAAIVDSTTLIRLVQTTEVRQVVHHKNVSRDRSTLAAFQLQKSFANDLSFSAAYTWSKSQDVMSLTSSIATSNLANTPLDGTLEHRNLRTSAFDVPHKITLSGTANLPFGLQASAVYTARAGTPYAYVGATDLNGDGNANNDLIYVPLSQADIRIVGPSASAAAAWDRLNAFITSEKCLNEQRGRIMERTSCRNPWQKFLDLRLAKVIPTLSGQNLQVTADVFNFLNLLDRDWGINRETAAFQQVNFLTGTAYTTNGTATQSDDRWIYSVPTTMPAVRRVVVNSSRWRIQLGGKYIF